MDQTQLAVVERGEPFGLGGPADATGGGLHHPMSRAPLSSEQSAKFLDFVEKIILIIPFESPNSWNPFWKAILNTELHSQGTRLSRCCVAG